jgi:hypothetical protein
MRLFEHDGGTDRDSAPISTRTTNSFKRSERYMQIGLQASPAWAEPVEYVHTSKGRTLHFIFIDVDACGLGTDAETAEVALAMSRRERAAAPRSRGPFAPDWMVILHTTSHDRAGRILQHPDGCLDEVNVVVDREGTIARASNGREKLEAYYTIVGLDPNK